jgi:MinD-like ATPase involved in chromosome partitioning or flagellar assembly
MALKVQMYSFKGGAGRTVSTANIARVLASERKRRVLAIDMDVESAGLSVLFDVDDEVESRHHGAIQDILRGFFERRRDEEEADFDHRTYATRGDDDEVYDEEVFGMGRNAFFKNVWPRVHIRPVRFPDVLLIPARRILTSSKESSAFHDMNQRFEQLLIHLQRDPEGPEFILFDSASGIQNTAILGLENCDVLVVFVRWSRQFIRGTKQFLTELVRHPSGLTKLTRVILVPTAVPRTLTSKAMADGVRDYTFDLQKKIASSNLDAFNRLGKPRNWIMLVSEGIPDADELRWDDRIISENDPTAGPGSDLHDVLISYRQLADLLIEQQPRSRA